MLEDVFSGKKIFVENHTNQYGLQDLKMNIRTDRQNPHYLDIDADVTERQELGISDSECSEALFASGYDKIESNLKKMNAEIFQ